MTIKVFGSGCPSCKKLYENAKEAAIIVGGNIEVKYITDLKEIMKTGIMSMPALSINEELISVGKMMSQNEIITIIKNHSK